MEAETETNICTITSEERQGVADMLGTERVVGYRPCFARAFGGASCALLLSQFVFWSQTPTVQETRRDGWFWKTQREISDETGLSRRETETARRKLREMGVLLEDRRGIPATLHFRVDQEAVCRCLSERLPAALVVSVPLPFARNRQTSLHKSAMLVCTNPPIKFARMCQSTSESTSKTTAKISQTRGRTILLSALGKTGGKTGGKSAERSLLLPECQYAVNRQGTIVFRAALDAARLKAAGTALHKTAGDGPAKDP